MVHETKYYVHHARDWWDQEVTPADSGRGLLEMGVGLLEGLSTMEPKMHEGGTVNCC